MSAADLDISSEDQRVLEPVRQVLRCSAVKCSVDNDRQFELDVLGSCSQ